MNVNDKVSIIVPIYNAEKYLEKCLESILKQTYINIELILINDGSTDNSDKICERYRKIDNRIKYFEQNNQGVSSARNKGMKESTGDFLIFVDADDYIEPNMIELLYTNAKENRCEIVICNYNIVNANKIIQKEYLINSSIITSEEFIKYMLSEEYYQGYLWNKLIDKRIISNYRFDKDISIMEDLLFLLELSPKINKVYILKDEYLYYYVQHNSSALHKKNIQKITNSLMAYEKILDYINQNNLILLDDNYYYYVWNYVYSFIDIYAYLKMNKRLSEEHKKKRKKCIKKMLKKALKRKVSKIKKFKLIVYFYFPMLYYILKRRKVKC